MNGSSSATRNCDGYYDFKANPSLADALADVNVGDKIKVEQEIIVLSKDDKGIAFNVEPESVIPNGYEKEEPDPDDEDPSVGEVTPTVQPPGALSVAPVQQAMYLRKKGGK